MTTVDNPKSFEGWRDRARQLLEHDIAPTDVLWYSASELGLAFPPDTILENKKNRGLNRYTVPKSFFELAECVASHRDPIKWDLLYRIVWKLTHGESNLLKKGLDPDLITCNKMVQSIRRDCHKMKAFVRFKKTQVNTPDGVTQNCFVAWFEPEHLIVRRMAPFFKKRFTNHHWSILTPDQCVHWNQKKLLFTEGVNASAAPTNDNFEELWLTYYKNIFNPARLKEKAMCSEMPKKYWKNLPEAELIEELVNESKRTYK